MKLYYASRLFSVIVILQILRRHTRVLVSFRQTLLSCVDEWNHRLSTHRL